MSLEDFQTVLLAESWTQDEIDDLEALVKEIVALGDVHKQAKLHFSAALSRWNTGMSAKVGTLGAAFSIPNPTDLAGAQPIVKENLQNNLMAYVTTIQALGSSSHLDNILPLVGDVNV
jgi:hypothetical protein